jgi:hypothetical protein
MGDASPLDPVDEGLYMPLKFNLRTQSAPRCFSQRKNKTSFR